MYLVNCFNCKHEISETALICPACGKPTVEKSEESQSNNTMSTAKWISTTAIVVALGPAVLLGGVASLALDLSQNRNLRIQLKKSELLIFSLCLTNGIFLLLKLALFGTTTDRLMKCHGHR